MKAPPSGFIIPRKVTKSELRRIFNENEKELARLTNQRVEKSSGLASLEYQQEPGTTSHIYDWFNMIVRAIELVYSQPFICLRNQTAKSERVANQTLTS